MIEGIDAPFKARLAGFKVPKRIRFAAELPRTATGKVRRGKLGQARGLNTINSDD